MFITFELSILQSSVKVFFAAIELVIYPSIKLENKYSVVLKKYLRNFYLLDSI